MNFFRRAIRYCWRQKIRSIILLLVFTLLASAALTALSVGHATAEGTDEVKQTVGASIHIEIDSGNTDLYGSGSENEWGTAYQYNGDYITQEVIDAISKVDGVVNYSAESEGGYWGAGINFEYFTGSFNIDFTGGYGQSVPYTVTLNSELSANFLNGTYTLEEGRHIQPDDSYAVLISKELADKNGLSVGDDITMYDLDSDSENTFEIVGIFSGTEGMSKDAIEQIKVNITKSAVKGIDKIDISLKPVDLGHIEVKMQIGKDGKLQAHIISSRPETMEVLQKEIQTLEKAFNDAGFQTDEGSLSFSFRGGNQANQNQEHDNGLRNFISDIFEKEASNDLLAGDAFQNQSWNGTSGLNIRV